jgi:hypothetical protein
VLNMTGYESLKAAVERDCNDRNSCGCFNPEGCNLENARIGEYGKRGYKSCFHKYCNKFKWVIDRAKHYGEKLGLNWEDVLTSWEADRNYWYMNYYQDSNQPEIKGDKVRVFETVEEMLANLGERKFRCPACGGISTDPYKCNSGLEMSKGKKCDWKVYGLFGDLGKGVFVYCKDKLRGETIFMPVAWEKEAVKCTD